MPRSGIKAPTKTTREAGRRANFSIAQFGSHHGYSAKQRVNADKKYWKLTDARDSERKLVKGEGPTASDIKYRHNLKQVRKAGRSRTQTHLRGLGLGNRAR
jgi:hypothetical protein